MIRVSFVWRRLLTDHPEWVEFGALDHDASVPLFYACPRCYAGWPGPAVRIERA